MNTTKKKDVVKIVSKLKDQTSQGPQPKSARRHFKTRNSNNVNNPPTIYFYEPQLSSRQVSFNFILSHFVFLSHFTQWYHLVILFCHLISSHFIRPYNFSYHFILSSCLILPFHLIFTTHLAILSHSALFSDLVNSISARYLISLSCLILPFHLFLHLGVSISFRLLISFHLFITSHHLVSSFDPISPSYLKSLSHLSSSRHLISFAEVAPWCRRLMLQPPSLLSLFFVFYFFCSFSRFGFPRNSNRFSPGICNPRLEE